MYAEDAKSLPQGPPETISPCACSSVFDDNVAPLEGECEYEAEPTFLSVTWTPT